jgi:hypothetical protein
MLHCSQSTPTSAVWNLNGIALAEITGIIIERVPLAVAGQEERLPDAICRAGAVSKRTGGDVG